MKSVNITDTLIRGKSFIVKDYYDKVLDYDTEEVIGVMAELPKGIVSNIWIDDFVATSTNMLEFMLNNKYGPLSGYTWKWGQPVKAGAIDVSKANRSRVIGSMKNIWKDFEREHLEDLDLANIDIKETERLFWNYYITKYNDKFHAGVEVLAAYVDKKRKLMSPIDRARERELCPLLDNEEIWHRACRDYMEYLIRVKTVRGFIVELVFFKALAEISGGEFIESDSEEEKNGIDGFLLLDGKSYPVCIKPNTFRGGCSPVYEDRLVKYRQSRNDLSFYFSTGVDMLEAVNKAAHNS